MSLNRETISECICRVCSRHYYVHACFPASLDNGLCGRCDTERWLLEQMYGKQYEEAQRAYADKQVTGFLVRPSLPPAVPPASGSTKLLVVGTALVFFSVGVWVWLLWR